MNRRALACAAFIVTGSMTLIPPVNVYARGFAGHHGFAPHGMHHYRGALPSGRPFAGTYATYPRYYEPVTGIPDQIAPAYSVLPHCTPSVETVTVPMESGGTRQITIRRCSP